MDLFKKIVELRQNKIPAALVTVVRTEGSTPRKAGAKLLVDVHGKTYGTVGGGAGEAKIVKKALSCLRENRTEIVVYNMAEDNHQPSAMICGGTMEFFIEPLPVAPTLFIFGGGHVGLALYQQAQLVHFPCEIIDDRKDILTPERFPNAQKLHLGNPAKVAASLAVQPNDFVVIATRHHKFDLEVLTQLIGKPLRYLGMLASIRKKAELFEKLRAGGVDEKLLQQVYTPVGLSIGAETPEEIAVSIMAEIIAVKNQHNPKIVQSLKLQVLEIVPKN